MEKLAYLKTICKIGQGVKCCRYVVAGTEGIECAKKTSLAAVLDARVAADSIVAQGDNCGGFPAFTILTEMPLESKP